MKTIFALLFLLTSLSLWAQQEDTMPAAPKTEEERFYDGPQVNPEVFDDLQYFEDEIEREVQEEEALPYDRSQELYPYEELEIEEGAQN